MKAGHDRQIPWKLNINTCCLQSKIHDDGQRKPQRTWSVFILLKCFLWRITTLLSVKYYKSKVIATGKNGSALGVMKANKARGTTFEQMIEVLQGMCKETLLQTCSWLLSRWLQTETRKENTQRYMQHERTWADGSALPAGWPQHRRRSCWRWRRVCAGRGRSVRGLRNIRSCSATLHTWRGDTLRVEVRSRGFCMVGVISWWDNIQHSDHLHSLLRTSRDFVLIFAVIIHRFALFLFYETTCSAIFTAYQTWQTRMLAYWTCWKVTATSLFWPFKTCSLRVQSCTSTVCNTHR